MMDEADQGAFGIQLHIDEVVLHNFAPSLRHAIAGALEAELTRLFTVEGVPPTLQDRNSRGRVDGGHFEVAHDASADVIGASLARTLYQYLSASSAAQTAKSVGPANAAVASNTLGAAQPSAGNGSP